MNKSQRRQIEREFYNYKNNKQMAAEYVASHALDGFAVDYSRDRVQSTCDNGNENKILSRIDKSEYLWKWCLVYEKTYERFIWTGKEKLMDRRYVQEEDWRTTCTELTWLPQSTYFHWLNEIWEIAYLWAKKFGLF